MSAVQWRKSSRSGGDGGDCVEVASLDPAIAVRDSKNPDGAVFILDASGWRAFVRRVKASELDLT